MVYLWSDLFSEMEFHSAPNHTNLFLDLRFGDYSNDVWLVKFQMIKLVAKFRNESVWILKVWKEIKSHKSSLLSYPKISRIVHVNRHIAGIDSFYTVDGDILSFVFIFISWFPKGFCGAVCQAANHGRSAWSFYVNNAG